MKNRERFLVRYPVADTWPQFIGSMLMVAIVLGLLGLAFALGH